MPGARDLAHLCVGNVEDHVLRAGGEEGLGVRFDQHEHRSRDGSEHPRILNGGGFVVLHPLLEKVEQMRDATGGCLDVAHVCGDSDLRVVEGKAKERPSRGRQVALGCELGCTGE